MSVEDYILAEGEDKFEDFMEVFLDKTSITSGLATPANLASGEEPLSQSKAWELGDGIPENYYNKEKSEISDNLGFHINLRNQAISNIKETTTGLREELGKMTSVDDDNLINTPEERKLHKEVRSLSKQNVKEHSNRDVSNEHIKQIFSNAKPEYLESFLSTAADNNIPKELIGDSLENMTMKEQYVRGKPLNVYPDKIFREYLMSDAYKGDPSSGSAFAQPWGKNTGEIFTSESYKDRHPSGVAEMMLHESAHLTGNVIPSGPLIPGQHQIRPEEQRADYNLLKELIEGGAIKPEYEDMKAALSNSKANWQKRDEPVKQVTGPFKGDDPAKFFYENEFAGWKGNAYKLSSKVAGEDVNEFGMGKFYEKMQSMAGMTKKERNVIFKEFGMDKDTRKEWEDYFYGKASRLDANQNFDTNVIQKLYDEYHIKEPRSYTESLFPLQ